MPNEAASHSTARRPNSLSPFANGHLQETGIRVQRLPSPPCGRLWPQYSAPCSPSWLTRENRKLIERSLQELTTSLGEIRELLAHIEGHPRIPPPPNADDTAETA